MAQNFRSWLYAFWQFTWGLPQNMVGLLFFLVLSPFGKVRLFHNCLVTDIHLKKKSLGGITLGMFVFLFLSDETYKKRPDYVHDLTIHEFGHTVQSLILGPFWQLTVGLPSFTWANLVWKYFMHKNHSYYWLYCEGWANVLGCRFSKDEFRTEHFRNHGRYDKPMK